MWVAGQMSAHGGELVCGAAQVELELLGPKEKAMNRVLDVSPYASVQVLCGMRYPV
jgi:hypothetical protein